MGFNLKQALTPPKKLNSLDDLSRRASVRRTSINSIDDLAGASVKDAIDNITIDKAVDALKVWGGAGYVYEWMLDSAKGLLPDYPDFDVADIDNGQIITTAAADTKIPVLYGFRKIGGILRFVGKSGTNSEYIHYVLVLCEGQIEEIGRIYIDDLLATDGQGFERFADQTGTSIGNSSFVNGSATVTGTGTTYTTTVAVGDLVKPNGIAEKFPVKSVDSDTQLTLDYEYDLTGASGTATGYTPYFQVWRYFGSTTQSADTTLVSAFTEWTTNHKLLGLAYVHIRFLVNSEAYFGAPRVAFEVKGKKLLDTRTSTTAYSTNNALALYDYMTNDVYGAGIPTTQIDTTSVNTAATACDATITEHSGGAGTIPRFECNGVIDTALRVFDNLKALKASFRCRTPRRQGKYYFLIEAAGSSTFSFDASNIRGGIKWMQTRTRDRLNVVKTRYTNRLNDWSADIALDTTTADNSLELTREFILPFETNPHRAEYHAQIMLKKTRLDLRCTFVATPKAFKVEVGDIVDITWSSFGWTSKLFRVDAISILTTGFMLFACVEHSDSVYTETTAAEFTSPANTTLPSPWAVGSVTSLSALTGSAYNQKDFNGKIDYRAFVSWTSPADATIKEYQISWRENGDSWDADEIGSFRVADIDGGGQTYISGLKYRRSYAFRVRAINFYEKAGPWSQVTSIDVDEETGHIYYKYLFDTLDAWDKGTTGSGITYSLSTNGYLSMTWSLTSSGTAALRRVVPVAPFALSWSENRRIRGSFKMPTALVYSSCKMLTGYNTEHFGFYINDTGSGATLYALNSTGVTSVTSTVLTSSMSTTATYRFFAEFTAGSQIYFEVTDGTSTWTATHTTDLPNGSTDEDSIFSFSGGKDPAQAAAGEVRLSEYIFEQDP